VGYSSSADVNRDNEGRLNEIGEDIYNNLLGQNPDDIDINDLPEYINWNNVNGYSFYPPIVNQACGNCYLIAFNSALSSRIMIWTNGGMNPDISIQQQLDCNFYTEGCDGGLPINNAKWAWEFELVDTQCYDRATNGVEGQCINDLSGSEDCITYEVENFYYVGGNYGGVSEELIMKERVAHGPVTAVLNAPPYLQMYQGCILEQECSNDATEIHAHTNTDTVENSMPTFLQQTRHRISSQSLWERGIEWEMVNHSIVIVGYGMDDT
jgi:hypothetical protein